MESQDVAFRSPETTEPLYIKGYKVDPKGIPHGKTTRAHKVIQRFPPLKGHRGVGKVFLYLQGIHTKHIGRNLKGST